MNSLYTSGIRQYNSIASDLERLRNGDNSASLLGQISASLAAMNRTIDDYDSMTKRELIKVKQEKAQQRVQKFRTDYADLRNQFETLKVVASAEKLAADRTELLSSSGANPPSAGPADARRRFLNTPNTTPQQQELSESPFRTSTPSQPYGAAPSGLNSREFRALDEHTFLQNTETRIDEFLSQGREVLDNLVDQRNMLKGTQRRLLDAANTLGLSRNVIGWIERRSTQDIYIFIGGTVFTFVCFFLIWKYFG